MNTIAQRLGFWSSALAALTFLIFIVCFAIIAATQPLFIWTNMDSYIAYRQTYGVGFATVAQAAMLCFGPLYVLILNSVYETVADGRKILVRAALALAVGFAMLTGMHYFVQISAVRLNFNRGTFQGIEHFLQAKPDSPLAAINMLGWTIFFGLSSLLVAPVFRGNRLQAAIRRLFWINGVCCLLAGVGFVLDWVALVFVTINLGMGGAVTALTVLLALHFHRGESPANSSQIAEP
jgi:hypothetical protein